MASLLWLIDTVLSLYLYAVIIAVILSWLIGFRVINTSNQFVYMIADFFYRITEPVFAWVRRWMPTFGQIDLSPIVVLLAIGFARSLLREYGVRLL
ncbi:MAG: YggT family protein [Rhodospirillales bacterium]|nr:YggT family protein [Rhodospirillales bacterium]